MPDVFDSGTLGALVTPGAAESKADGGVQTAVALLYQSLRDVGTAVASASNPPGDESKTTVVTVTAAMPLLPVTTITGVCVEPFIRRSDTGQELRWHGLHLGGGDTLAYDHRTGACTLNGAPSRGPSGAPWALDSGANGIEAGAVSRGAGFSASLAVTETAR